MSIIGLYPQRDPIFQNYHIRQFILARNRLSHFPETNQLLDNFVGYENLLWKQSRNKIFLISTIRPHRMNVSLTDLIVNNIDVENIENPPQSRLIDLNEDPNFPETLITIENGLTQLVKGVWNQSQIRELKNRISSYDYFASDSAFSEIYTASVIGRKIGFDNVDLNPPLLSGKNSDIKINLNGKEVYLELTSTTNSLAEIKIKRIFDDFAEFLGTLDTEKSYTISIWINTLSFPQDEEGHIDEDSSKSLLKCNK